MCAVPACRQISGSGQPPRALRLSLRGYGCRGPVFGRDSLGGTGDGLRVEAGRWPAGWYCSVTCTERWRDQAPPAAARLPSPAVGSAEHRCPPSAASTRCSPIRRRPGSGAVGGLVPARAAGADPAGQPPRGRSARRRSARGTEVTPGPQVRRTAHGLTSPSERREGHRGRHPSDSRRFGGRFVAVLCRKPQGCRGRPQVRRRAGTTLVTKADYYQRKWTKIRPKFLESFSTRW
jgi:hypothetical protein